MKKIITLLMTISWLNGFGQSLTYSKVLLDSANYAIESNAVVHTYDNGYIIAGDDVNIKGLLLKVDSMGNPQWNKLIRNTVVAASPDVIFNSIIPTYDSSLVVAGFAYNNSNQSDDAVCFKINIAGDTLWTKRIAIAGYPLNSTAIEQTADSGFIMVGTIPNNVAPYEKIFVLRIDATGNVLWNKILSGANNTNECNSVKQTPDGGFILVGYIENQVAANYTGDCFILKLDASGAIVWSNKYHLPDNSFIWGRNIEITNDGFFCRLSSSLMKTDSAGNVLWCKSFSPVSPDGFGLRRLSDNNYVFVYGGTFGGGGGIVKTDTAGNVIWDKWLALAPKDVVEAVDTGLFIVGNGPLFGVMAERVFWPHIGIIKTDSTGYTLHCISPGFGLQTISDTIVQSPVTFSSVSGTVSYQIFPGVVDSLDISNYSGCVDFLGSVNENNADRTISLSPNPATNELRIKNSELKIERVEIYDVLGQRVFSQPQTSDLKPQTLLIDVSSLNSGMYFVKVKGAQEEKVAKFLKE